MSPSVIHHYQKGLSHIFVPHSFHWCWNMSYDVMFPTVIISWTSCTVLSAKVSRLPFTTSLASRLQHESWSSLVFYPSGTSITCTWLIWLLPHVSQQPIVSFFPCCLTRNGSFHLDRTGRQEKKKQSGSMKFELIGCGCGCCGGSMLISMVWCSTSELIFMISFMFITDKIQNIIRFQMIEIRWIRWFNSRLTSISTSTAEATC